ncbi:MAG: hypothetical protein AB8I08_31320 [Sandaracinaceae bacterium]
MRSTRWIVLFVVSLSFGCGEAEEAEEDDTVEAPEPVAPLEISTPEEDEPAEGVDPPGATAEPGEGTTADEATETPETMESLRARVAELEAELASCQGATTPEGVEVPSDTAETTTANAGTPARRQGQSGTTRTNNRGLLGTLLGPDEPAEGSRTQQGQGSDEPRAVELPDPTRILFGQ